MNHDDKILAILEQVQGQLNRLEESQAVIEYEISEMKTRQSKTATTLIDIQRDQTVLKQGQSKMQMDMRDVKADIEQIREDTSITRDAVNGLGEWTEVASDVLKISYPLEKSDCN